MYDIRINEYEAPDAIRWAEGEDEDSVFGTNLRIAKEVDEDDTTYEIVVISDEQCSVNVGIRTAEDAENLIRSLRFAIDSGWFNE